jgi:hypothetical protein
MIRLPLVVGTLFFLCVSAASLNIARKGNGIALSLDDGDITAKEMHFVSSVSNDCPTAFYGQPLTAYELWACGQGAEQSRMWKAQVDEFSLEFNNIDPRFMLACSSVRDTRLVDWSTVTVTSQGTVGLFNLRVEGSSIPDTMSAMHSRFGVLQFKRNKDKVSFSAHVVLAGRPLLSDSDSWTIVTHTPITCSAISLARPSLQEKHAKMNSNKPAAGKKARSLQSADEKPAITTSIIESNKCMILPRTAEQSAMTPALKSVQVCYVAGKKHGCEALPADSVVRKIIKNQDDSLMKHIGDDQSSDLCVPELSAQIKKLSKSVPKSVVRAAKKGEVELKYRVQVGYFMIDGQTETYIDGKKLERFVMSVDYVEGVATLGKRVSKRSDDDGGDDDDDDDWVLEDDGIPEWLVIVTVVGVLTLFGVIIVWVWFGPVYYSATPADQIVYTHRHQ